MLGADHSRPADGGDQEVGACGRPRRGRGVRECAIVTVQFSRRRSAAIGLPTMVLRPTTTACRPRERDAVAPERLDDPGGRAGDEARLVEPEPADVDRMEAVDVLLRVDPVEDVGASAGLAGQRQLHEDAVDGAGRRSAGRGARRARARRVVAGQQVAEAREPRLGAGAGLRADVDPGGGVVADQHRRRGRAAGRPRAATAFAPAATSARIWAATPCAEELSGVIASSSCRDRGRGCRPRGSSKRARLEAGGRHPGGEASRCGNARTELGR